MKKFLSLLLVVGLVLMTTNFVQAQQRTCGTVEKTQESLQAHPELLQVRAAVEEHTQNYLAHPTAENERVVYTIPVVVHVVYNTTAQNISDAQVQSQITALNADYRKLNSDASSVPSAFASLATDVEFEFCLAQRDPSGNATNGITRTYTTVTSFSGDAVKGSSQGHVAWDRSKYLNIWVCRLSGGTLGYAYLPGTASASIDGVVIDYRYFGTTGTAISPFDKGRTATHEIGHWFNLEHIWGDSNCGNDQVSDTPIHNTANYGCPSQPHYSTCSGQPREMTMNYMDYTDDACMYMFTTGQKDRMRAVVATGGFRNSLLTSNGCVPPTSSNCGTPTNLSTTQITQNSALLSWTAVSGATSYNIQGRKVGAANWTTLTSTTNNKQLGAVLQLCKQYEWKVQAVCSTGTSAYSSTATFTTLCNTTTENAPASNNIATSNREGFADVDLLVMPNPANNMVELQFESPLSRAAVIRIYDTSGKVVMNLPAYCDLGANQQRLDISELTIGYYFIEIDNGTQQWREKLAVVR
jgi:hypothetical protein